MMSQKLRRSIIFNDYSQQQLENYLSFGSGNYANDNRTFLTYVDDAIMFEASLTIIADIPEPSSLLMALQCCLMASGLGQNLALSEIQQRLASGLCCFSG